MIGSIIEYLLYEWQNTVHDFMGDELQPTGFLLCGDISGLITYYL